MRIRSEWVTGLTVTGLAVCAFILPRPAAAPPVATSRPVVATSVPARDDIAAAGIDYTPVGAAHPVEKKKAPRPAKH